MKTTKDKNLLCQEKLEKFSILKRVVFHLEKASDTDDFEDCEFFNKF